MFLGAERQRCRLLRLFDLFLLLFSLLLLQLLNLAWSQLLLLVFVVVDLLLPALNLNILLSVVRNLLLLLKNANLVPEQVKVLLLDNLGELFLREWELVGMLIILLLQILQQHLLLIRVQLIQVNHHILAITLITIAVFNSVLLLPLVVVLLNLYDALLTWLLLVVVAFVGLVHDVLLNDILLQLTHLLRVKF
jgi:hypothetical protein